MSYDIIGDIHGHFDELVVLLRHLGYREIDRVWRHPERTAIFVGDLIDRGPKQMKVIETVRRMVEAGSAHCIMGNHELNAIAWATEIRDSPGLTVRPRSEKNRFQHAAFLDEINSPQQHHDIIAWFKTLPLWLEVDGLRVVHACWHDESIRALMPTLGANNTLTEDVIQAIVDEDHPVSKALEVICKGPEARLPEGVTFKDKEGNSRSDVRVGWWHSDRSTYKSAAHIHHQYLHLLPDAPLPDPWRSFSYDGPPVVFGHYWFTGAPQIRDKQFGCVDFSVANGGPLVAYRWDGERALSTEKLAWV